MELNNTVMAIIAICMFFNGVLVGAFLSEMHYEKTSKLKKAWQILILTVFGVPYLILITLWDQIIVKILQKFDVFFYYNLYFTDKFENIPDSWLREDNKHTRLIKKKYGRS